MPPRMLGLMLTLVAALALSGCARASVPAPVEKTKPAAVGVPIEDPSADDAAFARQLLDTQVRIAMAGQATPTFETTTLPDLATARARFSGTLVPGETLGRRLVAVVYLRALSSGAQPSEMLSLVYEGRLRITEVPASGGSRTHWGYVVPNASREDTTVGGMGADVQFQGPNTEVTWEVDNFRYTVAAPDLTKAEVVLIARSMVP